jgi:hypothetical protein
VRWVGAWSRQVERAQLAQIVVEDRLAAVVALLGEQLTDPLPGEARLLTQQSLDLVSERVELRGAARTAVAGRLARAERAPDRLPVQTGPSLDLFDRKPLYEVQAADLGPLLHPDHDLLLARSTLDRARLPTRPDGGRRPREGGQF